MAQDDMTRQIRKELLESAELKSLVAESLLQPIADAVDILISSLKTGGKIIWFGNGGSASDAQHLACELVVRFKKDRASLPSLALTVNTAVLTATGNDYGFEHCFSRQIESLANKNDVIVAISTSGRSPNVIEALKTAQKKGCRTIGLTGKDGGEMAALVDLPIMIPSRDTARIQEVHITIGHIICSLVEERLFA